MLCIWIFVCIAAFFIVNEYQFYVLGALVGLTDLVQPESIMKVLETRIPRGFWR